MLCLQRIVQTIRQAHVRIHQSTEALGEIPGPLSAAHMEIRLLLAHVRCRQLCRHGLCRMPPNTQINIWWYHPGRQPFFLMQAGMRARLQQPSDNPDGSQIVSRRPAIGIHLQKEDQRPERSNIRPWQKSERPDKPDTAKTECQRVPGDPCR